MIFFAIFSKFFSWLFHWIFEFIDEIYIWLLKSFFFDCNPFLSFHQWSWSQFSQKFSRFLDTKALDFKHFIFYLCEHLFKLLLWINFLLHRETKKINYFFCLSSPVRVNLHNFFLSNILFYQIFFKTNKTFQLHFLFHAREFFYIFRHFYVMFAFYIFFFISRVGRRHCL